MSLNVSLISNSLFPRSARAASPTLMIAEKEDKGSPSDRIAYYTELIKSKPDNWYAYYRRGLAKEDAGDISGAMSDLEQASKLVKPGALFEDCLLLNFGRLKIMYGDPKEGKDILLGLIKKSTLISPKDLEQCYVNLASAELKLKDYDAGIAHCDYVIAKINPKSLKAHINRGTCLLAANRYEEAAACYRKIVTALDKTNESAWRNLGDSLYMKKDLKGAREAYETALRLDGKDVAALVMCGNVCSQLEDFDAGERYYQRALAIDPKNESALQNLDVARKNRAIAWQKKGDALYDKKDYRGAREVYEKALKLFDKDIALLIMCGNACCQLDDFAAGEAYYTRVLDIDSNNADALQNRSVARRNLGDFKGAAEDLARANQLSGKK